MQWASRRDRYSDMAKAYGATEDEFAMIMQLRG